MGKFEQNLQYLLKIYLEIYILKAKFDSLNF
jgi:hypothetical protein